MMRGVLAPCGADATAVVADPDSPSSAPRSGESRPSATSSEYAAHLVDPSSVCVRACAVSRTHLPSTTRTATPLVVVRTSVRVRWLPCRHVLADPSPPEHDRTPPPPPGV